MPSQQLNRPQRRAPVAASRRRPALRRRRPATARNEERLARLALAQAVARAEEGCALAAAALEELDRYLAAVRSELRAAGYV